MSDSDTETAMWEVLSEEFGESNGVVELKRSDMEHLRKLAVLAVREAILDKAV